MGSKTGSAAKVQISKFDDLFGGTGNTSGEQIMTGGGRPPGMKVAAAMCDKPVQKMSLKERLEAFKVQAAGADRADTEKVKRKEETL